MNNKLKIEKGIEIPTRRKSCCKYPFREMEIGDSFIVDELYSRETMSLLSSHARNWKNRSPDCKHYLFSLRKVEGNKIRIWRIK